MMRYVALFTTLILFVNPDRAATVGPAAQVAMWKREPNAVPYRWGAFILQGDWH